MKFLIGGENFYSPLILLKRNKFNFDTFLTSNYNYQYHYFTGGGIYSLYYILSHLALNNEEYCLLPSYLCPTITSLFDKLRINYKYYRINNNLKIDINFLVNIIDENCKALLFINYFGFPNDDNTNNFILSLKERGIVILQDISQAFLPGYELIGDYCFNSFRKFIPIDGSFLLSRTELNIIDSRNNLRYLAYRHSARILKYLEVSLGINTAKLYLLFIRKSEIYYYDFYNKKFDPFNKYLLKKIIINEIIHSRRSRYNQLLDIFSKYALIKELPDKVVPLGFPIIISSRDEIKANLASINIYCPVHWKLPINISQDNYSESIWLSNNILTLPINETINDDNFIKYIDVIKLHLKSKIEKGAGERNKFILAN